MKKKKEKSLTDQLFEDLDKSLSKNKEDFKTRLFISSSNKKDFDEKITYFKEIGGHLSEDSKSYLPLVIPEQIINPDPNIYYQLIEFDMRKTYIEHYNVWIPEITGMIDEDNKKIGPWRWWYQNGEIEIKRNFMNDKLDGLSVKWYENGQKNWEGTYKDGRLDGLSTSWYENGQKKTEGTFKDGRLDGLWTGWYDNGQKKYERTFKDGEKVSSKEWNEDGSVKE